MTRRTLFTCLAIVVPTLALAIVGIGHPSTLNDASALYWRDLHIGILAVFPLLGFIPWLIVRGRNAVVSWVAGILGFLYAAFYTGLDVLAGIGAGGLQHAGMDMAKGTVYELGDQLGLVGSIFLLAGVLVAGGFTIVTSGPRAIPGTLIIAIGAVLFMTRHIFFPLGVLGQVCLAVGGVLLVLARVRAERLAVR